MILKIFLATQNTQRMPWSTLKWFGKKQQAEEANLENTQNQSNQKYK